MIHEIKNLGKIEALLGSIIIGLAGLVAAKFQIGEMVDVLILVLIVILVITIIMLQLLYYLKYIVQKEMWIREQRMKADVQNRALVLEIKKIELQLELTKAEV